MFSFHFQYENSDLSCVCYVKNKKARANDSRPPRPCRNYHYGTIDGFNFCYIHYTIYEKERKAAILVQSVFRSYLVRKSMPSPSMPTRSPLISDLNVLFLELMKKCVENHTPDMHDSSNPIDCLINKDKQAVLDRIQLGIELRGKAPAISGKDWKKSILES